MGLDWTKTALGSKEDTLEAIRTEYNEWFNKQYGKVSEEERKKLGAVFTPPDITIELLDRYDDLNGNILDPACGAGNLLMGCLIAGFKPDQIYGNDYEAKFVEIAQKRIAKYCKDNNLGTFKKWHIHQGDATLDKCYEFSKNYRWPKEKEEQIMLWEDL